MSTAIRILVLYPMRPAPGLVEDLLGHLARAGRPLIVAGGGLLRLSERLNVPVCTTMTGQGTMPDDHPLSIGVIGDNGYHPHPNRAMEESDFVLFVGSRMGSVVTIGWTFPQLTPNKRVAQIDINPEVMANNYENVIPVAGDAKLVLSEMLAAVPEDDNIARPEPWISHLNALRSTFWQNARRLLTDDSTPLRPERAVRCFNEALEASGQAALIYSDAVTPTPYMTRFLKINDPATHFAIPRAFGGLGSALPATVGAWRADPKRRPIGLFGDGSFGMTVGELATLVRLRVPAILILFNNGVFGWIKGLHRLNGHNQCLGVDVTPPKGQAIAEAFDLKAWTASNPDQFDDALAQAFAWRKGPCFIDMHVKSIADRVPPVYSWLIKNGRNPLALDSDDITIL